MFEDLDQILLTIVLSLGCIFALLFVMARLEPKGAHRAAGQPSVRGAVGDGTASHRQASTMEES